MGVQVSDLLRNESLFLMDVGFGNSAVPGLVLAGRIMANEDFAQTTGAALPFGVPNAAQRALLVRGLEAIYKGDLSQLSPEKSSGLSATIIRGCLETGAMEHIRYDEPGAMPEGGRRRTASEPFRGSAGAAAPRRVGRNDPCPCGSRKKFKHCCGVRAEDMQKAVAALKRLGNRARRRTMNGPVAAGQKMDTGPSRPTPPL